MRFMESTLSKRYQINMHFDKILHEIQASWDTMGPLGMNFAVSNFAVLFFNTLTAKIEDQLYSLPGVLQTIPPEGCNTL